MTEKTKEARTKAEKRRIGRIYKTLPGDVLDLLDGLIDQAAFLRVELEEMRTELGLNGWVDKFQNSPDLEPFERDRPLAKKYIDASRVYQNIIKQLDDRLAKSMPAESKQADDGFDDFRKAFK